MSSIDRNEAFSLVVGLIKHLNDNYHKWLVFHFSIQAALIVAISTLIEWDQSNTVQISKEVVLLFSFFGISLSGIVCYVLHRNRIWFKFYIKKGIKIEGEDPYIWKKGFRLPGWNLQTIITAAHILIALGWLFFFIMFMCGVYTGQSDMNSST